MFGGGSTDGRGEAEFKRMTTDVDDAKEFLENISASPYAFGHVYIAGETLVKAVLLRDLN